MNNKTQQRFDRSIREALEHTRRVQDAADALRPPRDIPAMTAEEQRAAQRVSRGYCLYLDPQTGATVWGPK
jgi:hypothetical protein